MKRIAIILSIVTTLCFAQVVTAAPYPLQQYAGGTGTNATSTAGQVPVSTGSSTYTPATIGCSGGCTWTAASGSLILNAASTSAITATTGNWAGTFQNKNASDFLASSTNLAPSTTIPTNTNQLTNGAGFITTSTNQNITLSGVVTGSGSTAITTAYSASGVASGTYSWGTFTVASSGIVTSATANSTPVTSYNGSTGAVTGIGSLSNDVANGGIDFSAATGTNITAVLNSLSITQFTGVLPIANGGTNATSAAAALTNLGGISTSTYNASITIATAAPLGGGASLANGSTISLTCSTCLTGNQVITLTGPVTGSGATSIATTITSPLIVATADHTTVNVTSSLNDAGTMSVSGKFSLGTSTSPVGEGVISGDVALSGQFSDGLFNATATTPTTTLTFSGTTERYKIVLGETTTTIYLTNFVNFGTPDMVGLCQDSSGSRTVTWAVSSTNAYTTVDWGTQGTPTLSTAANKCDWFTFWATPADTNENSTTVDGAYGQNGYTR